MLKLGKLADYATVLMTAMAVRPQDLRNAHELAEHTHVPAPTVSKLLKLLSKAGLAESLRGASGGYRLARTPGSVTIADVIRAVEGPIAITQCSAHGEGCGIESTCGTKTNWRLIDSAIRHALESVTLEQMARPMTRSSIESPVRFMTMAARS